MTRKNRASCRRTRFIVGLDFGWLGSESSKVPCPGGNYGVGARYGRERM